MIKLTKYGKLLEKLAIHYKAELPEKYKYPNEEF